MTSRLLSAAIGAVSVAVVATLMASTPSFAVSARPRMPVEQEAVSDTFLNGVSAISRTDAWAVGHTAGFVGDFSTLIKHWDGSSWTRMPSPNPGGLGDNILRAVSAVSPQDAWAVGFYSKGPSDRTLTVHWDGSSWRTIPSPSPGGRKHHSYLTGVTAISARDAWAVGYFGERSRSIILHWDGVRWSTVESPNPGTVSNELLGVSATSPTDAWAVGSWGGRDVKTLLLHWDGASWTKVPGVPTGKDFAAMNGVSARSASDVWAVGYYDDFHQKTLIEHWDGSSWGRVSSPNPGAGNLLYGVDAISATDVWAVGGYGDSRTRTLTQHWDGKRWTTVASPTPRMGGNLKAVSASSATDAWALGDRRVGQSYRRLIDHWDGTRWTR
jgi:hypothetical protein